MFAVQLRTQLVQGPWGPRAVPHPFALPRDELVGLCGCLVRQTRGQPAPVNVILPAAKSLPFPSPQLVHDWDEFDGIPPTGLRRFVVDGLAFPPAEALQWLTQLPAPSELPPTVTIADDLAFWVVAACFVLEILAAQRTIPALEEVGGGVFHARWRASLDHPEDSARFARLAHAMPPAARAGAPDGLAGSEAPPADLVLADSINTLIDAAVREWHGPRWRRLRGDDLATAWLNALYSVVPGVQSPTFSLARLGRAHAKWVRQLQAAGNATFRILLRLGVPKEQGDPWSLDFMLQARDDPSLMVALNPEQIEAAIRFWEKQQAAIEMDLHDAMRWLLEGEGEVDAGRGWWLGGPIDDDA
jgi:hypothetical protein